MQTSMGAMLNILEITNNLRCVFLQFNFHAIAEVVCSVDVRCAYGFSMSDRNLVSYDV